MVVLRHPFGLGRSQACHAARRRGRLARIALVDLVLSTWLASRKRAALGEPRRVIHTTHEKLIEC